MRREYGWAGAAIVLLGIVAVLGLGAAPAVAQGDGSEGEAEEAPDRWLDGRVSGTAFGGQITGATSSGSSENLFFRTTFEQDEGTVAGVRGGLRVWWRLHAEVEYFRGSPGITTVLTDLQGRGRTEVRFADMDLSVLAASARFDLTDARVRPFLSAGVASLSTESELESANQEGVGVLFGGGVEVGILGPAIFRADVRGLRSDLELLGEAASRGVTTQLVWTAGFGVRF